MLYGLYISGLAAIAYSSKFDVIANNVANLNTIGYKPSHITFQERLAEALENPSSFKYYNSLIHKYGGAPYISEQTVDQSQGPVESTGKTLDFALSGEGFFSVKNLQTNKVYYTRAGNFIADSQGRLLTQDGKYGVLDAGGDILNIDPAGAQISISGNGMLFQGEEEIGSFQVVTGAMKNFQENLFELVGTEPQPATDYKVIQGSVEGSNANPVAEMTEMLKILRVIETNLNMVKMQDGTLDRLVNDIGRPIR